MTQTANTSTDIYRASTNHLSSLHLSIGMSSVNSSIHSKMHNEELHGRNYSRRVMRRSSWASLANLHLKSEPWANREVGVGWVVRKGRRVWVGLKVSGSFGYAALRSG